MTSPRGTAAIALVIVAPASMAQRPLTTTERFRAVLAASDENPFVNSRGSNDGA